MENVDEQTGVRKSKSVRIYEDPKDQESHEMVSGRDQYMNRNNDVQSPIYEASEATVSRSRLPAFVSQWWYSGKGGNTSGMKSVEEAIKSKYISSSGTKTFGEKSEAAWSRTSTINTSKSTEAVVPRMPKGFFSSNFHGFGAVGSRSSTSFSDSENPPYIYRDHVLQPSPEHLVKQRSFISSYTERYISHQRDGLVSLQSSLSIAPDIGDTIRDGFKTYLETFFRLVAFAGGPERTLTCLRKAIDDKSLGLRDFGLEFLRLWSETRNCAVWLKNHRLPVRQSASSRAVLRHA